MLKRNYDYQEAWYDTKKFDNGYFGYFEIGNPERLPPNWYSVALSIGKKKKKVMGFMTEGVHSNFGETNVGSGLEPLIWAKQRIIEFIEMKKLCICQLPIYIYVEGADSRRYRVYKWALTKIGFKEGIYAGRQGLVYKIDKPE